MIISTPVMEMMMMMMMMMMMTDYSYNYVFYKTDKNDIHDDCNLNL